MHPESEAALAKLKEIARSGKRIVFVSGNYIIVHPGHLRHLKFAAECGDMLAVGVNNQPNVAFPIAAELRLEGVRAIGLVDYAFMLHDEPEDFIAALQPAAVVKGKEFESRSNPEKPVVEAYGGQLLFSSGDVVFSSLDLLKREFREFSASTVVKPLDFPVRHGFDLATLRNELHNFSGLRALVIGDLIVDEYIACDALGMSQEDPTIVVTPVLTKQFVGAAAIAAGHARGLGVETKFISVAGDDAAAAFSTETLRSYGVDSEIIFDSSRPTTLKQRYRAEGKTLLRVSHLRQHAIDRAIQEKCFDAVRRSIGSVDLLVFSDFNYGCLPQPLVDVICQLCREHRVPMVADSQSSSQIGDVSRFQDMLLLKPTEREARLAMRDFNSGLVVLAESLRKKANPKNLVLTLGAEGTLIHALSKQQEGWLTDRLPAFNQAPKDTAGAGDSFLICMSLALVAGADIWRAAYLGSLAAACQVGRIGNVPLTISDIEAEIDA